ncbi:MAG: hypothetical protein HXX19_20790 [Rhodoferax sp.]|nr:hypothetical protein [Rhodoferax sp.]
MTDTALLSVVNLLVAEVARLSAALSPWVGSDEMLARYGVTIKTLAAMEKRGEIPYRVRGRWLRSELLEWEITK